MAGNDKDMEKYLETLRKQKVEKDASKLSRKNKISMEEARSLLEAKSQEQADRAKMEKLISAPKAILQEEESKLDTLNEQIDRPEVSTESVDPVMSRYKEALKNTPSGKKQIFEQDLQNTNASMKDVKNLEMSLRNIQSSLTSLGGGGLGEKDVLQLILDNATNLSDSDLNYIASQIDDEFTDSAEVILLIQEHVPQIVDSAYVNALIEASDIDSAHVVGIINNTVDSAYVNALIEPTDLDSSDLWALEAALENYIDSAISEAFDSANLVGGYTTDDIAEAGNLYYTQNRFDSALAGKTTSDIAEGSNLYYTSARFDSDFGTKDLHDSAAIQGQIDSAINENAFDISTKTTDDVAEGSTNLYYTRARFDSAFGEKTTSNLSEGANLYYTDARVDANIATKTTDDLAEGVTNKYYGTALFDADFATKSTDSLGEGSNNLYYTDARVTSLVDSAYVQSRVTLEAGIHFKGVVSFADSDAPADPQAGDLYIADSDGIANATWVGIVGDLIEAQHGVVWAEADSAWHELGNTSVDTSVYVEKTGDTMTGTLQIGNGITGAPDLVVATGNIEVYEGNIILSEADGEVRVNRIKNSSTQEYVSIFKDATIKASFKQLENVSYQPFTYPNNTANTITETGTDVTLIHKGYVDSADGLRVLKTGDDMTGTLSVDVGGDSNETAFKILDGATSELSINGKGKMDWSLDGHATFAKDGKEHFTLKAMTNGTPQTVFNSWVWLPNSGLQFGADAKTQIGDKFWYMDGAGGNEPRMEMINGAYLAVGKIRPAPNAYQDGIKMDGKVYLTSDGPGTYVAEVTDSGLKMNSGTLNMNSNKITNLATPTASGDAASKSYVDANSGSVTISSTGQPPGLTAGGMYYDTYTGSLILKVS